MDATSKRKRAASASSTSDKNPKKKQKDFNGDARAQNDSGSESDGYQPSDHSEEDTPMTRRALSETSGNRRPSVIKCASTKPTVSFKDPDLEGELKKYTTGSLPYETVLVLKWYLWDGLSFQKVADKYKATILCQGKCGDTCKHTYSQQAATKRFNAGKEKFFEEFPEAANWKKDRGFEKDSSHRKPRQSAAGPSKKNKVVVVSEPKEPTEEEVQRLERHERDSFSKVYRNFQYGLKMDWIDGDEDMCVPVPKEALPDRSSSSAAKISKEYFRDSPLPNGYTISGLPTTQNTVHRYAQCVSIPKKELPVFDFEFKDTVEEGRKWKAHPDDLDIFKIQWSTLDLILLYVLSSSFGNARVCDLIVDRWIKTFRLEEHARKTHSRTCVINQHGSKVRLSKAICKEALELDAEALLYLFRFTADNSPARHFWGDVLAAKGSNIFLNRAGKAEIRRDSSISQDRSSEGKECLMDRATYTCQRYHLHWTFSEVCYKHQDEKAPFPDPHPHLYPMGEFEDRAWDKIDRLGDKLERKMDRQPLRKADYNWFDAEVASFKQKAHSRLVHKSRSHIDRRRMVGQALAKVIPSGFVPVDEDAEMEDTLSDDDTRHALFKLLIPEE